MENENLKPVQELTPFTKMIMTIGTLPSSFYSSMTYYESMVWLYEYLKNQVIPTVNNNAEAVEELQTAFTTLETFITEYFDNLDVQEEINNKLDEMAEDGTLTNLIKGYVDPIYEAYETAINGEIRDFKTLVNGSIDTQNNNITNFENTVTGQITTIDNKVNTATSGSPKGVYSTASDLTTADPDHDYIYVVLDTGYWYYYNTSTSSWSSGGVYQASSVEDNSIDGFKMINNAIISLSDNQLVAPNVLITQNGLVQNANYSTTLFYPLEAGDTYSFTNAIGTFVIYYDENYDYVGENVYAEPTDYNVTISSESIKYVRFNLNKNYTQEVKINGKSIINQFNMKWININNSNIANNSINGDKIIDNGIHPTKLIRDYGNEIEIGKIWSTSGEEKITYSGYSCFKNLIEVSTGDILQIVEGRATVAVFYKADHSVNRYIYLAENSNITQYCTANDKYLGLTIKDDNFNSTKFYLNHKELYFNPIKYNLKWLALTADQLYKVNDISNSKTLFIGDSITESNYTATSNWVSNIVNWFGISDYTNAGMSGTGILREFGAFPNWYNAIDDYDSGYDLILIMGDMNDWSNKVFTNSNLGSYGDSSTSTFYGTMKLYLEKIINKYPTAKIGWIISTPRYQNIANTSDYLNGYSSIFESATNIIKIMCNNYSIPVLDLYHESNLYPWNSTNNSTYFYNGDHIHPNNDGHLVISNKIREFIIKNF